MDMDIGSKSILIFVEDDRQRRLLGDLLRAEDFAVFDTGRVLEAIHILKREDVGMVIASQSLNTLESQELRDIIDEYHHGLSVVFVGSFHNNTIPFTKGGFKEFLHDSLRSQRALGAKLEEYNSFLFSLTGRLLQIFEANDRFFFNNDYLVSQLAMSIAKKMGLDNETVMAVGFAALIRDIGKVGIQHRLLGESRRFNANDFSPIKAHPLNTVQLLRDIKFPWNVDSIIAQHHESYDGSGYPAGLTGRQISIGARIIHIADSYVAMTTDRPYRPALSVTEATDEVLKKAGSQFDPEVVEVFMEVIKDEPILTHDKRQILMLEREPTLAGLIRLSIDANDTEVVHASSTLDAIRTIRKKTPHLIVADVEMLDISTFANFYNTLHDMPALKGKPFIFVLPDNDYPRNFRGEKIHYLVKPVDIGELTHSVTAMFEGVTTQERTRTGPTKGISGTLDDFTISDIIQILNLGLKTAKVEIANGTSAGTIFLAHGKVVHASTDEHSGKEAFIDMTQWKAGTFQILHGLVTDTENVKMDTTHLLLEAARITDERERLRSVN
jgi:HD-GYP domain-containing protein (c-di-GMP phosphodiesterase class II)